MVVGDVFGKLTIVSRSSKKDSNRNVYWLCRCDCGNTIETREYSLKTSHTKSCGCTHKPVIEFDLTGKKFGRLTAIKYSGKGGTWLCRCDCGNEKNVTGRALRIGRTKKCRKCNDLVYKTKQPEYKAKYREEHRVETRAWNREHKKYRYKNDIQFRIAENIRSRTRLAIKNKQKAGKTMEMLGCSVDFLIKHLESRFDENMSWDNYGTYWEIDHIRPCASFDLTNFEQQRQCFHYSNLQPLEWSENARKNDKF